MLNEWNDWLHAVYESRTLSSSSSSVGWARVTIFFWKSPSLWFSANMKVSDFLDILKFLNFWKYLNLGFLKKKWTLGSCLLKLLGSKLSEHIGISDFLTFWKYWSLIFFTQKVRSQNPKNIGILDFLETIRDWDFLNILEFRFFAANIGAATFLENIRSNTLEQQLSFFLQ